MIRLWNKYWFLFSLALTLVVGFVLARPLAKLSDATTLRNLIVASVLFMTTLVLETRVIGAAIRRPAAALLGVAVNFGLVPLAAWGLSGLLQAELGLGLILTAAAPCTLASAAVWTRRAGGNDAVAIMVTVVTNLLCFVVTPLWLTATASQLRSVEIDLLDMIQKLAMLVLAPMVLAQGARRSTAIAIWADGCRRQLSIASQIGILTIVLMGAIKCGLRLGETTWGDQISAMDFVMMAVAAAAVHVATLLAGQWVGQAIHLNRADWIAVGFAGSQKTLMVGLQVAMMAGGGLLILPMVAYHVIQLLIDTIVADRLVGK